MTVVCKIKNKIVDLETWINNAEFDNKVNRIKRKMADYAERFDCELECVDGNVVCHIVGGYTITAFGYGSKYTIILKKGKKIIIDRFCEFEPVIDNMFDNDISHVFKILRHQIHYNTIKTVLDDIQEILNTSPKITFNRNELVAVYLGEGYHITLQHKGDKFIVSGTGDVQIDKVKNYIEVEVD